MYVTRSIKQDGKEAQLFMEYLIDGIVDFYYYRDDFEKEHYYADFGDNNLQELKNEEKQIYVKDIKYTKESKEYIRLIKSKFKDSYEVAKKVDDIQLEHKSLIKIARDYHNEVCKDKECIIYEKKNPAVSRFGLIIGINSFSLIEVRDLDKTYLQDGDFKNTYPSFGVFYNTNLPALNEKLHFQYEGTYNTLNLKNKKERFKYLNDIKLSQSAFANNLLLIYEYPKGRVKPIFLLGIFANYYFRTDYKHVTEYGLYTNSPFSKLDCGINLGIGLVSEIFNKKEINISARYQR